MTVHEKGARAGQATRRDMANAIRALAMDVVQAANSGHPGMPMGMADAAVALFADHVDVDPSQPAWPDRDRFVLSAGHGSMLQYAVHHLLGYGDMDIGQVKRFRQFGSTTPGHPEYGHTLGVETTTGPLGQGLATAVGMALAERMMAAKFGPGLVDHRTYVIVGDGCLQEGVSQEAIDLAGHLKLSRLIVLWDDNRISIDGATSLSTSTDQPARFRASRWHVQQVDGHDIEAVSAAIGKARRSPRPSLIACRTTIGKGAPNLQGSEKAHGAPLGAEEIAATRANIGWSHDAFVVPRTIVEAWREAAARGRAKRLAWEERHAGSPRRAAFDAAVAGEAPAEVSRRLAAFRKEHVEKATKVATRKASEMALGVVNAACPATVGGSADLTHSNLTLTKDLKPVAPGRFKGRYIHYGIREHAMAAAMNGIALHGGFIPYGGTFLTFSDYARGAMRLSALMGLRAIYVMTHDSIGLGEDGPTHQPVEHLAMLRATPNLDVFRPADIAETAEAWEIALANRNRPTVLVLSRQALPSLRERHAAENLSARGGYVLRETIGERDVTLIATGSEVQVARAASDALMAEHGLRAAIVSLPCFEAFARQEEAYRAQVLGRAPRIAVEAAARLGWDRWIGEGGAFVGMDSFGASAPAEALYEHFAITPEAVVARALTLAKGGAS